jgi:hypothetical protein
MRSETFKKGLMGGDASWPLRLQSPELAFEAGMLGSQALELHQCIHRGG